LFVQFVNVIAELGGVRARDRGSIFRETGFDDIMCDIALELARNIHHVERQHCTNWSLERRRQEKIGGALTIAWYSWISHIEMDGQLFAPAPVDDD